MNLANKITVARILLIPFFVAFIIYFKPVIALAIFLIAVISDGIDGYVARAWKQKTKLGAMLDPIADKLLIISAFVCLIFVKNLPFTVDFPPYVPIVVISREVIIILGLIVIYMMKGDIEIRPSMLGKLTTFFQMSTIVFVLAQLKHSSIVWNIMVACTILSGLEYVFRGSKLLSENH